MPSLVQLCRAWTVRYGSHESGSISTTLKLHNTCILPIFLYGSECWTLTKRDVHKTDTLDQWSLCKLLGIKWYHHVRNDDDDVRRKTEQPHLSATVQARHLSLFGHIAWMPDESDTKQILTASPWRTGGDHQDAPILCGWSLPSRTWNHWISPWTKQLTWLGIIHSLEWCLRLALRTYSGACQKWIYVNEWPVRF